MRGKPYTTAPKVLTIENEELPIQFVALTLADITEPSSRLYGATVKTLIGTTQ